MDQKNPAQLDPKLKEAYDRVMGTVVAQRQTNDPQKTANETPPPSQPQAQAPKAQTTPPTLIPQPTSEFVRKKKGISPVILILGVIVFLAVYAFVWLKIFNIQLF